MNASYLEFLVRVVAACTAATNAALIPLALDTTHSSGSRVSCSVYNMTLAVF